MDSAADLPEQATSLSPDQPELVVQNGRLRGARRPLALPLTLLGREAGCEIRLNVGDVSPLHCVVVRTSGSLQLRDLQSEAGTLVNGERITTCTLRDGDLIAVGPFRFRVRMPQSLPAEARSSEEDHEALRVQAAAVAAQQAALTEEEARLQQRQTALQQQETQLAALLEEKRQRLLELREQVRQAHAAFKQDRVAHEAQVRELLGGLESARQEATEAQKQADAERQRLVNLRGRLKRRWHRHWAAERSAMRKHQEALVQQQRELENEAERLRQERATLDAALTRFNGDRELGHRQLQAARDALRQEQRQWQQARGQEEKELNFRMSGLTQRETILVEIERELVAQRQGWERRRVGLEKEAEGLETRIRNQRRKMLDQSQELTRLEAVIRALEIRIERKDGTSAEPPAGTDVLPFAPPVAVEPATPFPSESEAETDRETELRLGLETFERLSEELADQRLRLAEQFQRLVEAQQRWQEERETAAQHWEAAALQLQEREEAIVIREQAIAPSEDLARRHQEESNHLRRYLAGWQARLTARQASWEAERDRLLADLQAREAVAEDRLKLVSRLHARWAHRRRQETEQLRAAQAASEQLRQEWTVLREEWLRRRAALQHGERALAERTLALEQHRQACLAQEADPAATEKQLRRLRRHWTGEFAGTLKSICEQQQALQAEAARLESRYQEIHAQAERTSALEAEVARRQLALERDQALAEDEYAKLRQELLSLYNQRTRSERQAADLHDEVERIARLLMDEADSISLPTALAA